MTKLIWHKNLLVTEGRKLAQGEQGHLTADEWLYFYARIADELVGAQKQILVGFEKRIRNLHPKLAVERAAE